MKIVIAPDSFKDSLSAADVASAIARGLRQALPEAALIERPMADGGEGTMQAIMAACQGELRSLTVDGPLGQPTLAHWGWLAGERTAIIEMAEASGLQLLERQQRDACNSSTYGTGQLVATAIEAGASRIILAIGGSATNDAGTGMLCALGLRLADAQGAELPRGGLALARLASVDIGGLDRRLADVQFEVAADVDNPLCGPNGASHIFGPQKGATPEQVAALDKALDHFADHCAPLLGNDHRNLPGCGAAGGMGFAAKAFLNASFRPGVEVVAQLVGLAEAVQGADLVITGEGRFDAQTLRGKTPFGVARVARAAGVPVVVIAGTLGEGYQEMYAQGVDAAFSLASGPMTLEQACTDAAALLSDRARDIGLLWQLRR